MRNIRKWVTLIKRRIWSDNNVLLLKKTKDCDASYKKTCVATIKEVNRSNVSDCLQFEDESYLQTYIDMLDSGDSGQFGYYNGKCVFRRWALKGQGKTISFAGQNIMQLRKDQVYFHYTLTTPEARGKGIHSYAIKLFDEKFKGYEKLALVVPSNTSSLIGYKRNGYEVCSNINVKYRFFVPKIEFKDCNRKEKYVNL